MGRKGVDITNKEFGYLKVISLSHSDKKNTYWKCKCSGCNSECVILKQNLKSQKSCGCQLKTINKSKSFKGCGELGLNLFTRIQNRAKKAKYDFSISIEYLWELFQKQNGKCSLSGVDLKLSEDKQLATASLDRIDNSKGYIEGNVQWVHKMINFMKYTNSDIQFREWCNKVTNYSYYQDKTIAIWGGAGFIGCVLIQRLLDRGYNVKVFDNGYKGLKPLLAFINNNKFSYQQLDITNIEDVKKSYDGSFQDVIVLSGIVGLKECEDNHNLATQVNDIGWKLLCDNTPKDIRMVAAGTGSSYGAVLNGLCEEDSTPTNPLSHYGITKLAGEKHILDFGGKIFRFATAAGISPNIRYNLLPNELSYLAVKNNLLTIYEAENMRTFIDIRDFADVLIFGLEKYNDLKYQVYNAGDEKNNLSKKEIATYIKSKTGCEIIYHNNCKDVDARNYQVSYKRLNDEGFKCKYHIYDTLDLLINLFKQLKLVPFHSDFNDLNK